MKRPYPVHFNVINSGELINVRASLSLSDRENPGVLQKNLEFAPSAPWDSLGLLNAQNFRLKIIGRNKEHQKVLKKEFDSDSFGNFNFKFKNQVAEQEIEVLEVYELLTHPGLELLVGTFFPLKIRTPKKIIISDFDKTLVDTRYSTTSEVYRSLTSPLERFPTIKPSVQLLREHINKNFQPFILTASPHFYENAIRDWLYQNKIYTAGVFLKDYRHVFSLIEGDLAPKDVKSQGFYKLNHLVSILLMTGIPQELALMGDGFESDVIVYLAFAYLLTESRDPWILWKAVRKEQAFRLTGKQNSRFLNKLYQLQDMVNKTPQRCQIKIHIRKKDNLDPVEISVDMLKSKHSLVRYYLA